MRKYQFKPTQEEGVFTEYLKGKSNFNTDIYVLEVDHDADAPVERWKVTRHYISVFNGIAEESAYSNIVYYGKRLTDEQRDMMVELVMETEYLNFEND